MYDDVFVPTDGSDTAKNAASHAYSHAERYDGVIHILYVVEQSNAASIAGRCGQSFDSLRAEGAEITEEITDEAGERDLEATGTVEIGTPHRVIEKYVDEHGIDLIVMSTHGRSGLDRFLMGSVTERVLRTSETPVLTVRREQ
jgi:nucleotide-binding universal stress UspA family protein